MVSNVYLHFIRQNRQNFVVYRQNKIFEIPLANFWNCLIQGLNLYKVFRQFLELLGNKVCFDEKNVNKHWEP